jgi:dolichol-phosphate mannosyltransferase
MDADGQHDERLLPEMLHLLTSEQLDVVIGSRYVPTASIEGWDARRAALSRLAGRVAKMLTKADVRDLMSGFFMVRREALDETVRNLSQHGFKVLLDLFVSAPRPLRFVELPYHFRTRDFGRSKFDAAAAWEFGVLILDKLFGRLLPIRLILFALVGASGITIHLIALGLTRQVTASFAIAQTVAVIVAMTWNFFLNNIITYRDRWLKGWGILRGLLTFYLICAAGAVANVGVASLIFGIGKAWWIAGLAGALVGSVWNYAATSFLVWRS